VIRLPLVLTFIYLVYWGWVVLSGGAVSTVAFYTPLHGPEQPLFTVSRLIDVPAVYLFFAIIVARVSRYRVLLRRLDEELCNDDTYFDGYYTSLWWFFSALTASILAVFAYAVATEHHSFDWGNCKRMRVSIH
jgi:hypothetical protein